MARACLPYKITYFSNNTSNVKYYRQACLPYKITYFSNIYCFQIKSVFCLFTIQNYILLKLTVIGYPFYLSLFTIQNYILLKPQMSAFLYNMGLFTIQNYILLKLFGKPPQSPHTLVCHKKLHTSQIIEKLKMIQIKFDNHIKLHTSQIAKLEMRCCLTTI